MQKDTFSERLKMAMNMRGKKQVDLVRLAAEAGVKLGKSHMSQYVSGKTVPRAEILHFLAETLNVDEAWLTGDGPSEPGKALGGNAVGRRDESIGGELGGNAVGRRDGGIGKAQEGNAIGRRDGGIGKAQEGNADSRHDGSAGRAQEGNAGSQYGGSTDKALREEGAGGWPEAAFVKRLEQNKDAGGNPMRKFKKSSKLNNVLYDVRGPVVDEAERMEEAGTQILKLNIGNPAPFGFRTPDEVIYDMRRQLTECEGYSPAQGLFSARKAIMQYAQLHDIPNVSMEDIYTGNGVSELINLCMSALLDDGDEILIPSPDYPLWTACATLAGGKAVHYICDEQSEWYPDLEDIRKKISSRTKAIVIINPNNPTGAVYPREVLEKIVDIAREHQLIIFSDEIYDRLVMDDTPYTSIASLAPDLFCVTYSGLSKSHMIAGFRIGWMILSGNKDIARDYIEGLKMLSNMRLCSNVPAQSIVQTALGGHQSVKDYVVPGGRIYEQREFIYKALTDIPGITCVKPKAAFYMFPKLDVKKFNITNDEQFALDLLRDKKILLIHGGGFNWHQPDHFRVVYLPRIEVLRESVQKMADFFSYYRQQN